MKESELGKLFDNLEVFLSYLGVFNILILFGILCFNYSDKILISRTEIISYLISVLFVAFVFIINSMSCSFIKEGLHGTGLE